VRRLGLDGDVVVAAVVVELPDLLEVARDHGRVGELAGGGREDLGEVVLLDVIVTPEGHLPDPWELREVQDQPHAGGVRLLVDVDVGELLGREQVADRGGHRLARGRLAGLQSGPGDHLPGGHRGRADDLDLPDRLRLLNLGGGGGGGQQDGGERHPSSSLGHRSFLLSLMWSRPGRGTANPNKGVARRQL
jgi:hypothetical protein